MNREIALIDTAEYINGMGFSPADWSKEGLPIIRIQQINEPDSVQDFYNGIVPEKHLIRKGDLVFSWSATLKVVIWNSYEGALNQHLFKVIPKEGFDKFFLYYILDFNMEKIGESSQGSTMRHVKRSDLGKFKVRIPSLPVQRKIAHILSTVDRQIERTEQLIRKYEMVKEGMMQDLFTRGIDVKTGKLRPSYDEAPGRYKESELGWIPKEWELTTIGAICQKFVNGGTPPTAIREFWEGTIPWVTGADFLESFEIGEIRRKITLSAVKNSATHIIPKGNILLVTRTGVGKIAIAPFNIAISQDITGLELDSNQVSTVFFFYYLQVLAIEFKKLNQGTSINGITRGDIEKWKIILPSKSEQVLTEAILNTFNQKIKTEIQSHHILGMQKIALMQDLLTGKAVVKE